MNIPIFLKNNEMPTYLLIILWIYFFSEKLKFLYKKFILLKCFFFFKCISVKQSGNKKDHSRQEAIFTNIMTPVRHQLGFISTFQCRLGYSWKSRHSLSGSCCCCFMLMWWEELISSKFMIFILNSYISSLTLWPIDII